MTSTLSSPVFVGRKHQLTVLGEAWEQARGGAAAVVLVGGDAGVGKSRLLAEIAPQVVADGGRWLIGGSPSQGGAALPFAPLVGALRNVFRAEHDAVDLERVVGPARGELARLLPELGAASADAAPVDRLTGSAGRLFEVVLNVLHRLADDRPLGLAFEDLHWSDPSTLHLVEFLARNLTDEQVLLVGTYRTDELHRRHPLRPVLAELQRLGIVRSLVLDPFSRAEVEQQLGAILEKPPEEAVIDRIAQRSNGIAFFVEELASCAVDSFDSVPPGLEELLRTRVDALGASVQTVVRAVAPGTAGGRVPDHVLATVTGLDATELRRRLREAISEHVLIVDDHGYDFRHALMREVVEADLLPSERTALHAAYPRAFSDQTDSIADDLATTSRIAHHWLAAHDHDQAAAWAFRAGHVARHSYAFESAAAHYERVLALWEQLSDPQQVVGAPRVAVATAAANCLMLMGEPGRAVTLARAELRLDNGPRSPERDHSRAKLIGLLGRTLRTRGSNAEAIEALRSGLAEFPEARTRTSTLIKCELAQSLALSLRHDEAWEVANDALADARILDDSLTIGRALDVVGLLTLRHDPDAGLAAIEEGLAHSHKADDLDGITRAYVNLSDALRKLGRYKQSADVAAEGVQFTVDHNMRLTTGMFIDANRAEARISLGFLHDAVAATDMRSREASPNIDVHQNVVRAWALVRMGIAAGVPELLAESGRHILEMSDVDYRGALLRDRAEYAWLVGDHDELTAAVDDAERLAVEVGSFQYLGELCALGVRAEVDRLLDPVSVLSDPAREAAVARARHLADQAATLADRPLAGTPGPLTAALAHAELSRVDDAAGPQIDRWTTVARLAEEWSDPWHDAYAGWRLAAALLAADRVQEAAQAASRAHRLADEIGADALRVHVETLARRSRLALGDADVRRADDLPRGSGPGVVGGAVGADDRLGRLGLTPREVDVLTLIAEGRTNRQIGAELFISTKTASVHVSNILAKLGVATRTQAAATAHRAMSNGRA